MRITKENSSGLIIDIQEKLYPVMWEKEQFLDRCRILIKGLNKLGISLVTTQQYTKGLGETLQEIKTIIPEFRPIEKREFSCCDEPTVVQKLNELKAKNVIICGIESHVCVLQTAIDLKAAGLNPVVVVDCISSRKPGDMELAKERFRFEEIMMASAESILFELCKSSKEPVFKAISALIK